MTETTQPTLRRIQPGDAEALARFYNGLSAETIRKFRPLGRQTTVDACREIALSNLGEDGTKHDMVAILGDQVVGWSFVWDTHSDEPMFGIAVADEHQKKHIGSELMCRVMEAARDMGLRRVFLDVVKDNERARTLYAKFGFSEVKQFVNKDDGQESYRMVHDLARGGR